MFTCNFKVNVGRRVAVLPCRRVAVPVTPACSPVLSLLSLPPSGVDKTPTEERFLPRSHDVSRYDAGGRRYAAHFMLNRLLAYCRPLEGIRALYHHSPFSYLFNPLRSTCLLLGMLSLAYP